MGFGLEIGSAIAGLAGGIFKTGYDIWSNNRDFDYQKSLQEDIFNREDNAVQRRMKDLQAAGLNPNLAAGSAAGAGSVVGRSNTPSLSGNSVGTALDNAAAVQQLRAQRIQNEILGNQKKESAARAQSAETQATYDLANLYTQLGFNPKVKYNFKADRPIQFYLDEQNEESVWSTPLGRALDYSLMANKNSAYLLEKDYEYYDKDRFFRYLGNTAGALNGIGNFGRSLPRMRR